MSVPSSVCSMAGRGLCSSSLGEGGGDGDGTVAPQSKPAKSQASSETYAEALWFPGMTLWEVAGQAGRALSSLPEPNTSSDFLLSRALLARAPRNDLTVQSGAVVYKRHTDVDEYTEA